MFKKLGRISLHKFLTAHATNEHVLEVGGSKTGGHSYTRDLFPNRTTVDIDPARGPDVVGDAHSLPFKEGEFKRVLCIEVLEHVKDPRRVFNELYRVLDSGGELILTTRFVYPLHDIPHDYWRFTKYGLQLLCEESGFKLVGLEAELPSFSSIGLLLQRMAFQTKLHLNIPAKVALFLIAAGFNNLNFLLKQEFGNIQKSLADKDIMATGYYLIARKP